jgi:hypothetical protein
MLAAFTPAGLRCIWKFRLVWQFPEHGYAHNPISHFAQRNSFCDLSAGGTLATRQTLAFVRALLVTSGL